MEVAIAMFGHGDLQDLLKCQTEKPLDEFYAHPQMADGRLNKCKVCAKEDVRQNWDARRPEKLAYERERQQTPKRKRQLTEAARRSRSKNPVAYRARTAVGNALRDGRLERGPCEECGTTERVQAHHDDYTKPLEVRWLCVMCHKRHHGTTRF